MSVLISLMSYVIGYSGGWVNSERYMISRSSYHVGYYVMVLEVSLISF
jgi:hypothetical protein